MCKIKKTDIDRLHCPDGKGFEYLWDSTLPGFGVRCTARGIKSFVVRYRIGKKQRIKTLGRVNILDLSEARTKARDIIGNSFSGEDAFITSGGPVQTVNDLARSFQTQRRAELKPKTLKSYDSLWKHIKKAIGKDDVHSLDDASIARLKKNLEKTPMTFNRCLSLLLCSFKWQGLLTENHALKRAKKYREKPRQRILSKNESGNFFKAMKEYKQKRRPGWRYADLFLLLMLTGLRRDEWRTGRWEWIEWENGLYCLPDNKTGGRTVHLSSLSVDFLKECWEEQRRPAKGYIFPAPRSKKKPLSWTWRVWDDMRKEMNLDSFRIHDLRHTAGSFAHSYGNLTQRQVADFLGHKRLETSSRYIHDNEKKKSAEAASNAIAQSWGA